MKPCILYSLPYPFNAPLQQEDIMRQPALRSSFLIILLCLITGLTAGCAWTRAKLDLDTSAFLSFKISPAVNPDSSDRASPIVLNLFYLTDNRQFEQEEFISLLQNPRDRLGKDLLDQVRLKEFIPGENRDEKFPLPHEVKYIGVVAEYVQYEQAQTKLLIPIEPHTENSHFVRVDKLAISLKK
jgi:type VI secretion system protein VasD